MELKVEFLVSIKHPDDSEPMFLTEEQAKEVYDALHAKFGDFDQARKLSQLARESVARELRIAQLEATVKAYRSGPLSYGPGREAFEKYLEGGCSENGRVMRHEGMTLGPTCADPIPETGPSLQDDIETMKYGTTEDDADEQEAEFLSRLPQPSNTHESPAEPETAPEPTAQSNERQIRSPRTKETDAEKCVRLWMQYRAKYPKARDTDIVSRVRAHVKHLVNDDVRRILRECGLAVSDPTPRREVILNARKESPRGNPPRPGRRIPNPPDGYKVIDPAVWEANAPLFSHAEIRELASGGLAKIGLAIGLSEGDDW